jgi:hypothetical protein
MFSQYIRDIDKGFSTSCRDVLNLMAGLIKYNKTFDIIMLLNVKEPTW